MKQQLLLTPIFIIFLYAGCIHAVFAKPNVLIIYTDNQGSVDANCYGATNLITPTDGLLLALSHDSCLTAIAYDSELPKPD